MLLIKLLIGLSLFSLLVKIYYSTKLESKDKSKASNLVNIIGGTYGGGVIFPILRKAKNSEEKRIIQKANFAVTIFWSLIIIAMLLILFLS